MLPKAGVLWRPSTSSPTTTAAATSATTRAGIECHHYSDVSTDSHIRGGSQARCHGNGQICKFTRNISC